MELFVSFSADGIKTKYLQTSVQLRTFLVLVGEGVLGRSAAPSVRGSQVFGEHENTIVYFKGSGIF